jgi:hypothetical protein
MKWVEIQNGLLINDQKYSFGVMLVDFNTNSLINTNLNIIGVLELTKHLLNYIGEWSLKEQKRLDSTIPPENQKQKYEEKYRLLTDLIIDCSKLIERINNFRKSYVGW